VSKTLQEFVSKTLQEFVSKSVNTLRRDYLGEIKNRILRKIENLRQTIWCSNFGCCMISFENRLSIEKQAVP